MRETNLDLPQICTKIGQIVDDIPIGQKLSAEVHKIKTLNSLLQLVSGNRQEIIMVLGEEIDENKNMLSQLKDVLALKNEVTIAVFSYENVS